jgi:hypothetical protein
LTGNTAPYGEIEFVNTDTMLRVWTKLTRPDGRTLELAAGEAVLLALPQDFSDPYLKAAGKPRKAAIASGPANEDAETPTTNKKETPK